MDEFLGRWFILRRLLRCVPRKVSVSRKIGALVQVRVAYKEAKNFLRRCRRND